MKGITQDIYELIFIVFISRKLQLSSIVRILFLCPVPNHLQSRGVFHDIQEAVINVFMYEHLDQPVETIQEIFGLPSNTAPYLGNKLIMCYINSQSSG